MKVSGQKEQDGQSGPRVNHTSADGSGFSTANRSQSLHIERSGSKGLADSKATGPRTKQGKQRASLNSTKHGIFSKAVVLEGEARAEFEAVLTGLQETLQPKGTLEEILVEKLATITWRQRRLLVAEGAEIRKNMEFVELDQRLRQREEAENLARLSGPLNKHSLIPNIGNPDVL